MILNAIDPITKEPIASFELSPKSQIDVYESFMSALDYNPSTPQFAQTLQTRLKSIITGNDEKIDAWISALQKITTKGERSEAMCFILEDWIEEWYIADFIDQRFLILKFEPPSATETTNSEMPD